MRILLPIILLFFSFQLFGQQFSRVKINLDADHTMDGLARLGLDVDHGRYQPGKYFIGEFADYEILQIQEEGFATEILIEDLQARLHAMNASGESVTNRNIPCEGAVTTEYETPENYTYGTMGGYYTYQEMLDVLDQMAAMYPDLFKARSPITTAYTTHENRPVYWVKISDNPETDETDEPEVLFTALHHAREPNSASQLIFYMWYLLENYDSDEEIKYLIDNTEMYFVPCVNPDGYVYNETTNPDGGGFWRKNRRENNDGSHGVDLNRNYPYEWGYNNSGSSPDPNSQTYRGPSPGSEPETQMIMDFCNAHQFRIALNYHTYSNLLIYPWGYVDGATPDHEAFTEFAQLMTQDNNYLAGFGSQTVGYTVNGNSDDWMYGEQDSKQKIYSMTPEVGPGSTGFWPPQGDIDGLNKDAMTMNLMAARLVLNYAEVTPTGDKYVDVLAGEIQYGLKKVGLKPGPLEVYLEPVSNNVASVSAPGYFGLFHLEETSSSLAYTLDPTIEEGDTIQFNIVADNGEYQWKTPVERIFTKNAAVVFAEPGDDLSQWSAFSAWGTTSEDYYSAPASITDSPDLMYGPNEINEIAFESPVMVKDAAGIFLNYWAKWDIEEDEDYVQVLASFNGNSYIPLCGKYTEAGTFEQAFDEPVYDGTQSVWVYEEIDLSEYLGMDDSVDFSIAFRLFSDQFIEGDGFYFDDLTLTVLENDQSTTTYEIDPGTIRITTRPNPATDYVILDIDSRENLPDDTWLQVFNAWGQPIQKMEITNQVMKIGTSNWLPGLYTYHLMQDGRTVNSGRLFIVK